MPRNNTRKKKNLAQAAPLSEATWQAFRDGRADLTRSMIARYAIAAGGYANVNKGVLFVQASNSNVQLLGAKEDDLISISCSDKFRNVINSLSDELSTGQPVQTTPQGRKVVQFPTQGI